MRENWYNCARNIYDSIALQNKRDSVLSWNFSGELDKTTTQLVTIILNSEFGETFHDNDYPLKPIRECMSSTISTDYDNNYDIFKVSMVFFCLLHLLEKLIMTIIINIVYGIWFIKYFIPPSHCWPTLHWSEFAFYNSMLHDSMLLHTYFIFILCT